MDARKVLPPGLVLDGKYRIERVIGAGGFGITYAATDLGLNHTVAVKEYYPTEIGVRDSTMSIRAKGASELDIFERLRVSFVQEARTLAKFRHPSIVRVISVFEAHGTAYMAMEFEEGRSLKSWMRNLGRQPTQGELDRIFMPMLDALEVLHNQRLLHRDIAPDNIIIRRDGSPVLLDFGAARRVANEHSHQMTGLIKQGYSPQEQYTTDGKSQGPWTDIYALGATLYHLVTGSAPPESPVRFLEDSMIPAARTPGDYRPEFLAGIDAAMRVRPKDRPQSIAELRPMLFGDLELPNPTSRPRTSSAHAGASGQANGPRTNVAPQSPVQQALAQPAYSPPPSPPLDEGPNWALRLALAAVLAGGIGFGVFQFNQGKFRAAPSQTSAPATVTAGPGGVTIEPQPSQSSQSSQSPQTGPAPQQTQVPPPTQSPTQTAASEEARRKADETARKIDEANRKAADDQRRQLEADRRRLEDDRRRLDQDRKKAEDDEQRRRAAEQQRRPATPTGPTPEEERRRQEQQQQADRARVADEALRDGTKYVTGTQGVQIDHVKARSFFEIAANLGKPEAMSWLAQLLISGQGGEKDVQGAIGWYQTAANLGYVEAMRRLGFLYNAGVDVQKDAARAVEWFERAAQSGDSRSMLNLGIIYKNGSGTVTPDPAKARQWWERAAAVGDTSAMRELGEAFFNGSGAEKNLNTARSWYERAVTGSNHSAKWRLARMLNDGQGGDRDFPRAARMLIEASQNNVPAATQALTGTMAAWAGETRTELKRELQRLNLYQGPINATWDATAIAAARRLNAR